MTKTVYSTPYYAKNRDRLTEYAVERYRSNKDTINSRRRANPNSLRSILIRNAKKRSIPFDIDKTDFYKWWNEQEKVCTYCGVGIERMKIVDRKKKMAKRLTIDRKDNSRGYSLDNICLACMLCNFIKSNIFTYEEMLEIGKKYLSHKWQ